MVAEVRKIIDKYIQPEEVITELGKLKVLAIFLTEKNRQIIGGKVIEGELKKGRMKIEVHKILYDAEYVEPELGVDELEIS